MHSIGEHATVDEAGDALLSFILDPRNWWVVSARVDANTVPAPVEQADYQRRVGKLRICASVDVTPELKTFLRVGFLAPGLSPMTAADHLESFLKRRVPFLPNAEWQVEVDNRRWIHFMRRYCGDTLKG